MLRHYKLMGKSLAECESKHFYKALLKNPPKKQKLKLERLCEQWGAHTAFPFTTLAMARLKPLSPRLPLLRQELWVHTKVPHRAHMAGAHQHRPNSQQERLVSRPSCPTMPLQEHMPN